MKQINKFIKYFNDNNEQITLYYEVYLKIVKGCMLEFGNLTTIKEIDEIIDNSDFFNEQNFPPSSYNQVALLDHETIYDVSMQLLYGDNFWGNPNYKSIPLSEYFEWEKKFIKKESLNNYYIEYN